MMTEQEKLEALSGAEATAKLEAADIKVDIAWVDGYVNIILTDTADSEKQEDKLLLALEPYQAGAICALFIAGDDWPEDKEDLRDTLYKIAEGALLGVPQNLRPIP